MHYDPSQKAELERKNAQLWRERVKSGAKFLDKIMPGWVGNIDTYTLLCEGKPLLSQLFNAPLNIAIVQAFEEYYYHDNSTISESHRLQAETYGFIESHPRDLHWIDRDILSSFWIELILNRQFAFSY